jgi:hypothetical protein
VAAAKIKYQTVRSMVPLDPSPKPRFELFPVDPTDRLLFDHAVRQPA